MDPPELDPTEFANAIANYNPELRDFFSATAADFANYTSITQGEVGDCWLLAPIAALSRSPQLRQILRRNFTINDEDETYTIKLYSAGKAKSVDINGNLYILPADGRNKSDLLFAGQQQFLPEKATVKLASTWFAFIEKAVAVMVEGYHSLDGGDPDSDTAKQADLGFKILTNKPVTTYMIDDETDFSGKIAALLRAGAAIVFTTKANTEIADERAMKIAPDKEDSSGFNLLEDHAYVVDSISRDGSVQLYNPHGEIPKIRDQNRAAKLSEEDARYFGKRLDILPGNSGGSRKTRRHRTTSLKNRRTLS